LEFTKLNVALNQLDVNNCLFSPELLSILLKSYKDKSNYHNHSSKSHRKIIKDKERIYLICIRVLNNKEKSLVYNYIYYNDLFYLTLIVYFLVRNYFITENKHDWGKYLVLLNNKFLDYANVGNYIDIYNTKDKSRH
jgi:hypothetical protein